jgi:hypothetical protein
LAFVDQGAASWTAAQWHCQAAKLVLAAVLRRCGRNRERPIRAVNAGQLSQQAVQDLLFGRGITWKYLLEPWGKAIESAVSSSAPGWMTGLGSYAPLIGASYWNQGQRDKDTLSGR